MEVTRVQQGVIERIYGTILTQSGSGYTGLSDVKLEILRKSDGKYFDFNDKTFKSSGWTTRQGAMTEVSATNSAGIYYYDFETAPHSNRYVEEQFIVRVSSSTSGNAPMDAELRVGGYVDQIGVFEGGSRGGYQGMTPEQMTKLASMVWEVILRNKETAKDVLLSKSEFDFTKDKVALNEPLPDIAPVQKGVDAISSKMDTSKKDMEKMHSEMMMVSQEDMKKKDVEMQKLSDMMQFMMDEMKKNPTKDYTDNFNQVMDMIMGIDIHELNPLLDEIRADIQKVLSFESDHKQQADAAKEATAKMSEMLGKINEFQQKINAPKVEAPEPVAETLPPTMEHVTPGEIKS